MSRDPIGEADDTGVYVFIRSDPLRRIDADGRYSRLPWAPPSIGDDPDYLPPGVSGWMPGKGFSRCVGPRIVETSDGRHVSAMIDSRTGKICRILAEAVPGETNCAGYALGQQCKVVPNRGDSVIGMAEKFGYECKQGLSAAECCHHCQCREHVMVYAYIIQGVEYQPINRRGILTEPWHAHWGIENGNAALAVDFHFLRGRKDCSGYDYQEGSTSVSEPAIKDFIPSRSERDYFSRAQLIAKACCCKKN